MIKLSDERENPSLTRTMNSFKLYIRFFFSVRSSETHTGSWARIKDWLSPPKLCNFEAKDFWVVAQGS